jgi:TonB family protein
MTRSFRISVTRIARFALVALPAAPATLSAQGRDDDREPPLSAVLDSAGLAGDAAALNLELPRGVPPLFSIRFDSTGAVQTVRAMFDRIPPAYADPVVAAIRARLKPQPATGSMVYTYVRVTTGPRARVDRPRLHEHQPQLFNRGEVAQLLSWAAERHAPRLRTTGLPSYTVQVRFRVLTDGSADAEGADVMRSSGDAGLDQEALAVIARMRFRPATVEGIPVRVWVQVPITFDAMGPRPRPQRP